MKKNILLVFIAVASFSVSCAYGVVFSEKISIAYALPPQLVFSAPRALEIGNHYFSSRAYNLSLAEWYLKRALELDSDTPDAWHQLARIDFLRGDFNRALEKINTQIDLHGDSLMSSYYIRGLIFGYMGRFAEAEIDFRRFIAWNPDGWAGWNDLSWVYFAQGKYSEAADAAEWGLEKHPGNPWLLNSRGVALLNLGEKIEAEQLLTQALGIVSVITPETWAQAYPGNDPGIAERGLRAFRETVNNNLSLAGGGSQ